MKKTTKQKNEEAEKMVLAKIAEMPEPDRGHGLSESMRSSMPLHQTSHRDYGTECRPMPRTARSSAFSKTRRSSKQGTPP